MSHHSVPDPDGSDKALVRRSDIYVARRATRDGIIETEPLPQDDDAREYRTGDPAAREAHAYPPPPPRVPDRVRRHQSQVGITPHTQRTTDQSPALQNKPRGFMHQFLQYLNDDFENANHPTGADPSASQGPRIINISLVQDRLGLHLHLFISRGARTLLLALIAIIILLAMGKLSDALELLARFVF